MLNPLDLWLCHSGTRFFGCSTFGPERSGPKTFLAIAATIESQSGQRLFGKIIHFKTNES